MSRMRLVVLFGGMSSEHEVSLRSARSVLDAVDRDRFEPIPVGITRTGAWRTGPGPDLADVVQHGEEVPDIRQLRADLVFPVLHGPNGEDGTVQGLLELYGLPYVGSGVLASATCMDKAVQKHLIAQLAPSIPMVPWVEIDTASLETPTGRDHAITRVEDDVGYPCFSKPANLGSSVGVCKCVDRQSLQQALAAAADFDTKLVVERGIDAREIELAVLGNGDAATLVSAPGEIKLPPDTWYDYETKYLKDVATYDIPARLDPAGAEAVRHTARRAFEVMGCSGLARVDFLLDRKTQVAYLNELNTMPGFTSISMYPKLIEHAGVPYPDLVTRLCDLGLQRHRARTGLRVDR